MTLSIAELKSSQVTSVPFLLAACKAASLHAFAISAPMKVLVRKSTKSNVYVPENPGVKAANLFA
jgi:hypothetical protein